MNVKNLIFRLFGGALFVVGAYWTISILGPHAFYALIIMYIGLTIVDKTGSPWRPKDSSEGS